MPNQIEITLNSVTQVVKLTFSHVSSWMSSSMLLNFEFQAGCCFQVPNETSKHVLVKYEHHNLREVASSLPPARVEGGL